MTLPTPSPSFFISYLRFYIVGNEASKKCKYGSKPLIEENAREFIYLLRAGPIYIEKI